ncbi:serine/threonine-protein kinase [uncultured Sphingomonas sp.]|uniref:serine/threonine-protein kinase n=1 Tax=uncultured Sphingomonas sp. TaxID=158754 RepID=UPI002607172E|nr:serine/threonine-protein kinase [uncultured Sphingomonas sp.]
MTMLGRYRIDARIGEGAMAEVFRAHDTGIDRVVAIKALKPEYRRDPEIARRFLREATAAGTLSHAHIATIYDVGEADGVAYIAMELVAGRPLDEVLKAQGRMPYERVLALGAQMADALAYAHARGIVHRDVKPSNILLSDDGLTAKLLDFGVARIGDTDSSQLVRTQVGQMIGTPRYMSPEQALGLPVDHRSDLFSLGIVLYEMVTGKPAFAGAGLATLVLQIAQAQPDPVERSAADCPKGLRFIIDKLLAKKPERRFASGDQLAQALRRDLETATAENPARRRRGLPLRLKLPLILAATTALALAASVVTVFDRQQHALEHMAVVSGSSITAFITSNAAVLAADNAGLPPEQQDWAPLQAFVDTAAHDTGIRRLVVTDATGVVRAASDRSLIGRPYAAAPGEAPIISADGATVTAARDDAGFRFIRPIRYAGANFGKVDLLLRRATLDAAVASTLNLLIALSAFVMLVVLAIGWFSASLITRPIARLRRALDDAATGNLSFRISHDRRDEFGAAFDAFNAAAEALEPQIGVAAEPEISLTATLIAPRRAA